MQVSQRTQFYILTFFMFFNSFITPGGIIYGWPGLAQMLKNEGQYSEGCVNYDPHKTCTSQDSKLGYITSVGFNVATISTIFYGITVDRYSVKWNAVSGTFFMLIGFVLLAYSTAKGSHPFEAFIPGFALVAFGGLANYLAAFQFCSLYSKPTLILSIQSALFGAAGLTFTFFNWLDQDYDVSRCTSMLFYAGLLGFCILNMIFLYPHKPYHAGDQISLPIFIWLGMTPNPEDATTTSLLGTDKQGINGDIENGTEAGDQTNGKGQSTSYDALRSDDDSDAATAKLESVTSEDSLSSPSSTSKSSSSSKDKTPPTAETLAYLRSERLIRDLTPAEKLTLISTRPLKEELLDAGTIGVAMFFSIGLLCSNMYNANITTWLQDMGDSSGKFANAFVFISSLWPIIFNLFIDWMQKRWRYAGTSFIANTCVIIGYGFLFINNPYAQIPAFIIFAQGRSLLVTVMFSYVNVEYRSDHVGRVISFVTGICAVIGFLQLALQKILDGPSDGKYEPFVAGMIVSLTFIYYFSYWCYKHRV